MTEPSSSQRTYGADREKPLRCGYIGDASSGGLVLHDESPSPSSTSPYNPGITIDLGYGIPRHVAHELADKLDAVLKEIHEAQARFR